ncbi:conserved hypothetical protein (plasmid) [Bacillus anthracis str. A0488]|uniref:Uncharacterized protein n=1 Tax=Bacillus anthracis TaxID=1392 RepID=Q6F073_BACAN|nr:hypothetical protein BX_B0105 [Bacillus anthracis str. A2012]AAT35517.1 conserved hypothetical protein [Bacillus anthracis str. 'Ames Ancestor']ADK08347.1 conserved hypothetical protein [Bacillus cereus biovar anthracis str. CI]EDR16276.1 conserved hypothetical protein [Bacillus anthracis str. A0488]EDR85121.1 conserved hypothetical protein [Bacillus anthracis str. A0193]EDR90464.1 conserved hypothetical protein [Bacillus anthracis str. A0442]EDS94360.1 conserved hypothetical protein [Baci
MYYFLSIMFLVKDKKSNISLCRSSKNLYSTNKKAGRINPPAFTIHYECLLR